MSSRKRSWVAELRAGWHESGDFFDSPRRVAPSRSQVVVFVTATLATAAPLTQLRWAGGVPAALWTQPRIVVSPLFLDLFAGVIVSSLLWTRLLARLARRLETLTRRIRRTPPTSPL